MPKGHELALGPESAVCACGWIEDGILIEAYAEERFAAHIRAINEPRTVAIQAANPPRYELPRMNGKYGIDEVVNPPLHKMRG